MIGQIETAVASYPMRIRTRSYPGPNSNTFLAHIGREVPSLRLDPPANAIGKDYRPVRVRLGVGRPGVRAAVLFARPAGPERWVCRKASS